MSELSPNLSLPLIQAAQAQKHVTHNEAVELLDMIVQLTVQAFDATTPPGQAGEGQAWALGAAPTGVWASQGGQIASWRGGGWIFAAPQIGWQAWGVAEAALRVYTGNGWQDVAPETVLQNLSGVGVNTTSDAINKFAVAADATLLSHDGAGHQLKLNKAGAGDTASLLYQTNWSGRAEMGLAGNDDFSIKVSTDGSTFIEALRIDQATGAVDMPTSLTRQIMPYSYRHSVNSDYSWTAPTGNGSSLMATLDLGTASEPSIAWPIKGIFVPSGSVLHGFVLAGHLSSEEITGLDIRLAFQTGPWNQSWSSAPSTVQTVLYSQDNMVMPPSVEMQRTYIPLSFVAPSDGYFFLAARATPTATLTSNYYLYTAGALDVSCPPLSA